ncbi:helix-turn-helix domain-containing protein [Rickettsiales bacterium]|nr:helix-turn-helix domain-containing protein [Rickettsiales bacterium]
MKNKNNPKYIVELVKAGCYISTQQAAIYLSISPRTLEKYRTEGKGPEYLSLCNGGVVRYPAESILAFIRG